MYGKIRAMNDLRQITTAAICIGYSKYCSD